MVARLSPLVGKCALYQLSPGFEVWVLIKDAREVFGREDLLVTPWEGNGTRWVSKNALNTFLSQEEMQ